MRRFYPLRFSLLIGIALMPLGSDSAAASDPNRESLEILKYLQTTMRSMEVRLGNVESKLSSVNNVQGKVDGMVSSVTVIGGKVERMESILNKLQLTDQERKKWCNTDYVQSLSNLHKSEAESIRRQMSAMLQEISELIRSGMGKLLVKMDSLLTESSKSISGSVTTGGNYKPSTSSSSKLPSALPSTSTTSSRAGFELAGNDETINRGDDQISTLVQLNNKMDTLMGRCLPQPTRGSGDYNNGGDYGNRQNNNNGGSNNEMVTTLAQFRSLSQDTLNTMVKKIESTENQLLATVISSLEVPERLSQVKDRIEDNVNKLRSQVDGLSSNAPILRILRHIKTQLPDVTRVTCMDEQTSELLEKATSQVNTMINDYTKQIDSIGDSLTNVNALVSRLASLVDRYKKNNFVQSSNNTNAGPLKTAVTSWN